jgi:glyoxylase-like metal-dependent hydrolase (beta-lactamase superfamily II)
MTKTYYRDHLLPIADRLTLTDSPRPFPTGLTPDRDDLPRTTIEQRESDPFWTASRPNVESGISVFLTPGHTWGQQAIKFTEPDRPNGGGGRTIVFTPDVMPTIAHNGAAYSLSYDVEPYTSMISRRWLLTEAAARGWVLHLDHEPGHPLVRVRENAKGWFDLMPEAV